MRSPEELARIGFERSRVVIVNECHNGDRHCPRTRAIGRRLLPIAHDAGVRHLAMEALYEPFAREANHRRRLPSSRLGYLGQEDMRELIAEALALGWNLVPYECDFSRWQGDTRTAEFGNWRDAEEARNLTEFLAGSPQDLKLMVWCGNSHQRKTPQRYPGLRGSTWIRLGQRFRELGGIDPFVIDQSVTVEYRPGRSPRRNDVKRYRSELRELGGTGGFLRDEDPDARWCNDLSADAWLLSLDNSMV
jgi:erythromycin esterase-like protein